MSKHFTVYSKPGCPSCVNAKQLIQAKGDTYTELVIGTDIAREEFISLFPLVRTVPHILEDQVAIGGYDNLIEMYKETDA